MAEAGVARHERVALCTLFTKLGPDAPTLCAGWTTRDLAAHLVARDRYPQAIPGMTIRLFHPITVRYEQQALHRWEYNELVSMIRNGPPPASPVGVPGTTEFVNIHEYYIHHEDVRRPNGGRPRRLSGALDRALWWRLRAFGPYLFRSLLGVSVRLEARDGRGMTVLPGVSGSIVLSGGVGELFLFAYNRRDAARVEVSGDARGRQRLARARLGV